MQRRLDHVGKTTYNLDRQRWLLGAAHDYGAAVRELDDRLRQTPLRSAGLSAFRDHLAAYVVSDAFGKLMKDTDRVQARLEVVSYRLRIHGPRVTVTRFRPEPDYSAEVLQTFDKFRQGARRSYGWRFAQEADMNHVEAAILDLVIRLYPGPFDDLREYATQHAQFTDPTISRVEQEINFYLAYLDFVQPMRAAGLPFCYPRVTREWQGLEGIRIFDLAIAALLVPQGRPVVPNDLQFTARSGSWSSRGQIRAARRPLPGRWASLATSPAWACRCQVERVQLPLVDRIFTHFERQEEVEDLSSKLEADLQRIHASLALATSASLLIMNESFSSTSVADQLFIGRRVLRQIVDRGPLCVIVTFLDELASFDPAIVSMVSCVDPTEPARRTFEIVRRPADGLAYAMAIAEKHHVTYPGIKARLAR